ncbi:hypothetical protein Xcel_2927 [Xylanimonas cellulosilytica DSM 15894]|uniref:DUF2530 domain-containing protein n=1 Tax=Xylanimonas cellulosilytica (strain DSM 15894 / JCM 12276 / CECT 5975 / KCTC 9989 / LMG 20990 / NBRC 107835 / XIL07) TaxID=446471 RepID=D1BZ37_XYLCX|nr:DUF2530 domain-containing protein [Xylanimonas cellulosilytica]ACZ31934.1 hypothetical protein Xcel_2927 [Xylanimonas cellulosilytica DSM 15894]
MPSLLRILTRPETRRPGPPPLAVDLRKVLLAGIACWVVATVVVGVLVALDVKELTALWVCLSGLALGGLGLLWARGKR